MLPTRAARSTRRVVRSCLERAVFRIATSSEPYKSAASLSGECVVSSHPDFKTWLRIRYLEGCSILTAGGRRVRNLRGSKVLANRARAALGEQL